MKLESSNKEKMNALSSKVVLLPNNIIIEILLRLPAKIVYQFRYVCKNWFRLISEPEFIKKHLQLHSTTTDHGTNNPSSLFIITRSSEKPSLYERLIPGHSNNNAASIFSVDYNFIDDDDASRVIEIMNIPPPIIKYAARSTTTGGFMCLGSCNGLLGFCSQKKKDVICLWNPCTKEYKEIIPPKQPNKLYDTATTTTTTKRTTWEMKHTTYGFGYDPIMSEYKVLANACYFCVTNNGRTTCGTVVHRKTVANVYTLGTNSWRSIGEYPYLLLVQNPIRTSGGLLVGGALYWRATKSVSSLDTIVCFDLGDEKYREIPIPQCISHRHGGSGPISYPVVLDLKEYKGRLSILRHELLNEKTVEVWVLMTPMNVEEDGGGSWSKLFTISDIQVVSLYRYNKYTRLEPGICKDDEFLMVKGSKDLYWYNPTTNHKKTKRILDDTCGEFGFNIFTSVLTYTESLAFLNPPNTRLTGQKDEDEQPGIKVQSGKSKTRRLIHAVAKVARCFS